MNDSQNSIVCATDFTPASERALAWAATLARHWEARIDLVHILPPPSASIEAQATDVRLVENTRLDAAKRRLEATARALEAESGVPVRTQVLGGEPAAVICRLATAVDARMIVVGTHGRSTVIRWVLGSVAERIVRASRVAVAVVPPPADDKRDPVAASHEDGARPLRILAGLAQDPGDARVVDAVTDLRRRRPSEVRFLHLYWPQEQMARLGLPGPRDLLATDRDVVADLEPSLRRVIGSLASEPDVQLLIRPAWGEPAANLLMAAQQHEVDLIVVGAEERHGLARIMHPSVAASLAHRTRTTPVIFVPAPKESAAPAGPVRTPLFSTILAPTDLASASNGAVRHAYALLRGRGGVVELCHIHEHGLTNPPNAYEDSRLRVAPERRAEMERELRTLIPSDADSLGITTHVSVFEGGDAATAIVQAAERLHVDAISMGSHGRGGIAKAVLGSVADKVVRHAGRPVLLVRVKD